MTHTIDLSGEFTAKIETRNNKILSVKFLKESYAHKAVNLHPVEFYRLIDFIIRKKLEVQKLGILINSNTLKS